MMPTPKEMEGRLARVKAEMGLGPHPAQARVEQHLQELRELFGISDGPAGVQVGRSGPGDMRFNYPVLRCPKAVLSITVGGEKLHDNARNDYVQDTLCRLLFDVLTGAVRLAVVDGR